MDKETEEKLRHSKIQAIEKETIHFTIDSISRQWDYCPWLVMEARRDRERVTFVWQFISRAGDPNQYQVTGEMREVEFIPDASYNMSETVVSAAGNGEATFKLHQGRVYYFQFKFIKNGFYEHYIHGKSDVDEWFQVIGFIVAIPLSDERRALLSRTEKLGLPPEDQIRRDVEDFLNKQDALEEMSKKAVEKIKAKKLPQEEEQEQIKELQELIGTLKDRYGM